VAVDWHRRVWRISGPVMVSNVSVPMLGVVDTAVVGHLPEPTAIGAVALGALVFTYVYWGFNCLRMATTGFTAQAFGAGEADEIRATLARGLVLALLLGALVVALQGPIIAAALGLIEASPEVERLTGAYYRIRVWAVPAGLINYVALGWFIGLHRARTMFGLQLFMNGLNMVLDVAFVVGLGWGVEGVAWASLIAEYAAAVLALALVLSALGRMGGAWRRERVLDRTRLARTLAVNRDIFLRTVCVVTAFAFFTAQGARMGDVVLAVNAVLLNFFSLMSFALDGFAYAAEALVGSAVGARDGRALRSAVRVSTAWALAFAVLFTALYAAAGSTIVDLITDLAGVREAARAFLPWAAALPLVSVWSFQLDGIFIGATRGREMRNAMVLALILYLPLSLALMAALGNHGLWLSLLLFMGLRGLTLARHYPGLVRAVERLA
jgi:MATE family multidrug resistance protein